MNYTITELIWLFLVYAFLGWLIETVVGSVKTRKFTNGAFPPGLSALSTESPQLSWL